MKFVDCMGFAGGFTLGCVQAGFELAGKCELKGAFGAPNCLANRHILGDNWELQEGDSSTWEHPGGEVIYVAGNPPCSGFSVMSNKNFRGVNSPINACMWSFADYVSRVRPLIATFESVAPAFTRGHDLMVALWEKVRGATGLDYRLYHVLHNNIAVGGCAQRKRYFWTISQVPFGVEHPELSSTPTVWEAISDLEDAPATWESQVHRRPAVGWGVQHRTDCGRFDGHVWCPNPEYYRAVALLPEAGPWEARETISTLARRYHQRTGTLPSSWASKHEKLVGNDFKMGFHQLTRWPQYEPARVITGGAMMQVLHPTRDRLLTHREVARIMGFPDDWRIRPLRRQSNLRLTWGKGIPVHSGRWVATWVRNSILGRPGSLTGEERRDVTGRVIDVSRPRVPTKLH